VSGIGDWLYLVALLVVVYQRDGSPVVLGIVGAARVTPYILLSVPAGIVVDRFDRRMVLIVTDIARGLTMIGLAVLVIVEAPLIPIVALTILAACFSTFFGPAIGALLPSLTRDESELGPATSAWATLDNLAVVVGPALAGLLIAAGGLPLAFLINAASFGVVAIVLWQLPRDTQAPRVETPDKLAAVDGAPDAAPQPEKVPFLTEVRSRLRPLSGMTLINAVDSFVFGGLGVLTVVIAVDVLGQGDAATGYLNAAVGVGGMLGAIASGVLVLGRRLGPPLLAGGIVLGLGLIVLGPSGSLLPALVAMTVAAAGSLLVDVVSTTLFQRTVPDEIRGRTLGMLNTVSVTAYAAGSLLLPVGSAVFGVVPVLAAAGVAMVVATIVGVALIGPAAVRASPLTPEQERFARLGSFAGLPAGRLEAVARQGEEVVVAPGTVVIRQGDEADRFYMILEGKFDVSQVREGSSKPVKLRRMGSDEVFGEIGLISGVPRTATVTAATTGRLLALDGKVFLELVAAGPGTSMRFLDLHRGSVPSKATGGG
jgi:MFS family permease